MTGDVTTRMTLKPGVLVSLHTVVRGGVRYDRVDLEPEKRDDGAEVARWETTRVIMDKADHESAKRARGRASTLIRRVCVPTNFGLLCPLDREEELDAAIVEAKKAATAHNITSRGGSYIAVHVLKGTIASSDEEAVRAIASEVRGLLDDMDRGIRNLDVETVRKAAADAKKLGTMLDDTRAKQVGDAVVAARAIARQIVKRVGEGGQVMLDEIGASATSAITNARIAFLDLDEDLSPPPDDTMPPVVVGRFSDIETTATGVTTDAV